MKSYKYDAVIIGGGAAGLTASGFAANLGAKTMLIEAEKLGGDCTWTGCVPSKILLKAGKVAQQMRRAGKYGLPDTDPEIDFPNVMRHLHSIQQDIYEKADAPENFEAMGIEVVPGRAAFVDDHTVKIVLQNGDSRTVTARYFLICTGASAQVPPVEGVNSIDYLTSESLFEIDELPQELTIIGGGPIGTEMAQALNRLGSRVTVVDQADRILTKDDPELTEMLMERLEGEGIRYVLNAYVKNINQKNGVIEVKVQVEGGEKIISGDALLMATGRKANVENLNLNAAGVAYSDSGINVNRRCRTNQSHIYACGDVTGEYQFTHMSDHMAKIAVSNALLKFPMKVDADHVPWCTYCDPELAHVGATEKKLQKEGVNYEIYRFPYTKLDRALLESEHAGMIKVFAKKWTGKILGVSILGDRAAELISEYAVAMKNGVSLGSLSGTIHPYPSFGLGARRAADQWFMRIRPVWLLKVVKNVFGYRGKIPEMGEGDQVI